jgi:hypothetical protein
MESQDLRGNTSAIATVSSVESPRSHCSSKNARVKRLPLICEARRNELKGDVGFFGFGLEDLIMMGREAVPQ